MKTRYATALAAIAGVALGALGVRSLQAQGAPPAYVVGEVDVTDQASYEKAYVPGAMKAVADGGGTYLARGGDGEPLRSADQTHRHHEVRESGKGASDLQFPGLSGSEVGRG